MCATNPALRSASEIDRVRWEWADLAVVDRDLQVRRLLSGNPASTLTLCSRGGHEVGTILLVATHCCWLRGHLTTTLTSRDVKTFTVNGQAEWCRHVRRRDRAALGAQNETRSRSKTPLEQVLLDEIQGRCAQQGDTTTIRQRPFADGAPRHHAWRQHFPDRAVRVRARNNINANSVAGRSREAIEGRISPRPPMAAYRTRTAATSDSLATARFDSITRPKLDLETPTASHSSQRPGCACARRWVHPREHRGDTVRPRLGPHASDGSVDGRCWPVQRGLEAETSDGTVRTTLLVRNRDRGSAAKGRTVTTGVAGRVLKVKLARAQAFRIAPGLTIQD